MKVLALSGSLRAASINSALLRATARLAAPGQTLVFVDLGALPLFNPDLETSPPQHVLTLRRALAACAALLIAGPEYAHGISGSLENALDWLVSFESFVGKPVAALNASPRAQHAYAALLETLHTMSARIVPQACVAIALLGAGLDEAGMLRDKEVAACLVGVLEALERAVAAGGAHAGATFPLT